VNRLVQFINHQPSQIDRASTGAVAILGKIFISD